MDRFKISTHKLQPLERTAFKLEREIQRLLEDNLGEVFGIRFLASEFSTGDKHPGRIDSLWLDENRTPGTYSSTFRSTWRSAQAATSAATCGR